MEGASAEPPGNPACGLAASETEDTFPLPAVPLRTGSQDSLRHPEPCGKEAPQGCSEEGLALQLPPKKVPTRSPRAEPPSPTSSQLVTRPAVPRGTFREAGGRVTQVTYSESTTGLPASAG